MLWHVEISTKEPLEDDAGLRVQGELSWIGATAAAPVKVSRLYLLGGNLDEDAIQLLANELLTDPVVQASMVTTDNESDGLDPAAITICRKAGVMDPVIESIERAARILGHSLEEVRTGWCYRFGGDTSPDTLNTIASKLLANPVIENILVGRCLLPAPTATQPYEFRRTEVPLGDDEELERISREGGLALNLREMQKIHCHFSELGRHPTDIELETLAQTWSEHCKHKTFGAVINFDGRRIDNLLKSTIFKATKDLNRDFCVSVFSDNAGIVRFDENNNLCFKVETHNHPSAIEPYGGAGTGLGGVIRDVLGCGLGGKPVANTDVFCFGMPDVEPESLPQGVLHPLRTLKGVVAGVRDYGNRMGIPTVNGGVFFDERYTGNPLVYCGTIGLIPIDRCDKVTHPGDIIVALGGRTGRDGIHGATFSSMELHEESEQVDGSAVQIGNAIAEKRTLDVVIQARDRGLYRNITDCGAGGFSSAVGEMGQETGARVELADAPLKYDGLSYSEIWISEAQERMVLAVPPENLDEVLQLCESEDVEACVLGEFTDTGRLEVSYGGEPVADLDMEFLHNGIPRPELEAIWQPPEEEQADFSPLSPGEALRSILAHPNVASKEWIIRQYDHEVQCTSAVKPLVGVRRDGPGDAAVVAPVLGSRRGFAVGSGMNPQYGDLDPYHMACAAIDEALRNVVAVGGDPDQTCILDNFSWGNCSKPDRLGALVRASEGCYDAAMAFRTPFVSGKDSLNNEYATAQGTIVIPHSLLVTALSIVEDVSACVTMDIKAAGNALYVVGLTGDELGGSHYLRIHGHRGNTPPALDIETAPAIMGRLHQAMRQGLVSSCHDCSEGGIAVAAAEMAFAGDIGIDLDLGNVPVEGDLDPTTILFSESLTRFIVEIPEDAANSFESLFEGLPCARVGNTSAHDHVVIAAGGQPLINEPLEDLADIHRTGLTRHLEGSK